MTQDFGDFTDEDVLDDDRLELVDVDWDAVARLQERYDAIAVEPDPAKRKLMAKQLVAELNGEQRGSILVT